MNDFNKEEFNTFLEMSEDKRFEYLTGKGKLYWWQKVYIKLLNKWWTFMKKNSYLRGIVLWESIYKGRY